MDPVANMLEAGRKARLRRIAVLWLVAVAVLAGGVFGGKPLYRVLTGWRAKRLAAQAEALLGENKQKPAFAKAQAAFLLRPASPAAVRAMARTLTAATNAVALKFWQQLILAGQATEAERRACVELAIRTGALGPAADELRKLLDAGPNQPANLWLASQLFTALGDYAQTLTFATRAQMHDPTNQQYQLFLSSLLFDSPDAAKRSAARETLWHLARDNRPVGLEALDFLARRPDLSPEQRRDLITLLQQHPSSGLSQQLLRLDQKLRLEPGHRTELLDRAVRQFRNSDIQTLSQFAVWLNQHQEFQRALDAVPLEAALKQKELFLPHLDALASLDRWAELEKILDTKAAPLETVYFETFRARAALKLNRAPSATVHWNRALRAAERNPAQLTWLASYAQKCGEFAQAKKTLRSLIACAEDPRPAYRALEELTLKSGSTAELRDLVREMLDHWPKDPALRNDLAYLNLLLAAKLPESRQTAEELVAQFPDSVPFRTTLALACYRLKDYAAALRAYEGRSYDWRQALPGHRAVHAAVLAANGQDKAAREHALSIPSDRLREEELELIRPLL